MSKPAKPKPRPKPRPRPSYRVYLGVRRACDDCILERYVERKFDTQPNRASVIRMHGRHDVRNLCARHGDSRLVEDFRAGLVDLDDLDKNVLAMTSKFAFKEPE